MRRLLRREWGWLPLAIILVGITAVAGGRALPAAPIKPLSLGEPVTVAYANAGGEANGLIVEHTLEPLARPTVAPVSQLLESELNPGKAPLPSGSLTYVPILLYHYIRINPNPRDRVGFSLSTPPLMFAEQMQYLADHAFHVVSLHEAVLAIKNHTKLPPHPVVLTFDDGYADFFTTAIPIMLRHGFTATDFVISGKMGQWSFMTPNQVVAADQMGFNIGAHTVDHVPLAAETPAHARWEIGTSKSMLQSLLGHAVLDFAYPYGSFNDYDEAQAERDGFETAVSTLYGTIHSPGQLFYLSRVRIGGGVSLGYFAGVVAGPPPSASPKPSASVKVGGVAMLIERRDLLEL